MFLFSASFWQRLRVTGLLFALLALLGIQRCTEPADVPATCSAPVARPVSYRPGAQLGDTSTSAQPNLGRKANPRSRWHSVPGPAYLVYPLPRPPKQAVLDGAAAKAAQLHKI